MLGRPAAEEGSDSDRIGSHGSRSGLHSPFGSGGSGGSGGAGDRHTAEALSSELAKGGFGPGACGLLASLGLASQYRLLDYTLQATRRGSTVARRNGWKGFVLARFSF